jgi:hypothetical protein
VLLQLGGHRLQLLNLRRRGCGGWGVGGKGGRAGQVKAGQGRVVAGQGSGRAE